MARAGRAGHRTGQRPYRHPAGQPPLRRHPLRPVMRHREIIPTNDHQTGHIQPACRHSDQFEGKAIGATGPACRPYSGAARDLRRRLRSSSGLAVRDGCAEFAGSDREEATAAEREHIADEWDRLADERDAWRTSGKALTTNGSGSQTNAKGRQSSANCSVAHAPRRRSSGPDMPLAGSKHRSTGRSPRRSAK